MSVSSCGLGYANTIYDLPAPNQLLPLSSSFSRPFLKGLTFDPANPLSLKFLFDRGSNATLDSQEIRTSVEYFLAGLTIPESDLWVNLSPYEQERIVPVSLAKTSIGRNMLGQDYILKQLSASLTYPESKQGKEYWQAISSGNAAFCKIWIVPGDIDIYENGNSIVLAGAKLRVLTENDYLAQQRNSAGDGDEAVKAFKKNILPMIEKEVNSGKNFAQLRQMYHALILSAYFKNRMSNAAYSPYINKRKTQVLDIKDPLVAKNVYGLYTQAFKEGAYNLVQIERSANRIIKRSYFSGGIDGKPLASVGQPGGAASLHSGAAPDAAGDNVTVDLAPVDRSGASSDELTGALLSLAGKVSTGTLPTLVVAALLSGASTGVFTPSPAHAEIEIPDRGALMMDAPTAPRRRKPEVKPLPATVAPAPTKNQMPLSAEELWRILPDNAPHMEILIEYKKFVGLQPYTETEAKAMIEYARKRMKSNVLNDEFKNAMIKTVFRKTVRFSEGRRFIIDNILHSQDASLVVAAIDSLVKKFGPEDQIERPSAPVEYLANDDINMLRELFIPDKAAPGGYIVNPGFVLLRGDKGNAWRLYLSSILSFANDDKDIRGMVRALDTSTWYIYMYGKPNPSDGMVILQSCRIPSDDEIRTMMRSMHEQITLYTPIMYNNMHRKFVREAMVQAIRLIKAYDDKDSVRRKGLISYDGYSLNLRRLFRVMSQHEDASYWSEKEVLDAFGDFISWPVEQNDGVLSSLIQLLGKKFLHYPSVQKLIDNSFDSFSLSLQGIALNFISDQKIAKSKAAKQIAETWLRDRDKVGGAGLSPERFERAKHVVQVYDKRRNMLVGIGGGAVVLFGVLGIAGHIAKTRRSMKKAKQMTKNFARARESDGTNPKGRGPNAASHGYLEGHDQVVALLRSKLLEAARHSGLDADKLIEQNADVPLDDLNSSDIKVIHRDDGVTVLVLNVDNLGYKEQQAHAGISRNIVYITKKAYDDSINGKSNHLNHELKMLALWRQHAEQNRIPYDQARIHGGTAKGAEFNAIAEQEFPVGGVDLGAISSRFSNSVRQEPTHTNLNDFAGFTFSIRYAPLAQ